LYTNMAAYNWYFFVNTDLEKNIENSYEGIKNLQYTYLTDSQKINLSRLNFSAPFSYATVLDTFRTGYDENLWDIDNEFSISNSNTFNNLTNLELTNNIKLRSTAKNSIVTYNAIQKVFKSRLDEGRSHSRLLDFANSSTPHNFITSPKAKYESMLSKNKNTFFNVNFYNQSLNKNLNLFSSVYNSLNSTLLDLSFIEFEVLDSL
jgi:hypothetical protein